MTVFVYLCSCCTFSATDTLPRIPEILGHSEGQMSRRLAFPGIMIAQLRPPSPFDHHSNIVLKSLRRGDHHSNVALRSLRGLKWTHIIPRAAKLSKIPVWIITYFWCQINRKIVINLVLLSQSSADKHSNSNRLPNNSIKYQQKNIARNCLKLNKTLNFNEEKKLVIIVLKKFRIIQILIINSFLIY